MINLDELKELGEGELLQKVLEEISPEAAFMMGQIMGIMHKGDSVHIARLEGQIAQLEGQIHDLMLENDILEREGGGKT
jgi:hypothetical protein